MCSDCEDGELRCDWCGDECFGSCDDPDTCRSCWVTRQDSDALDDEDMMDELMDECINDECECNCHGVAMNEILADLRDDPPEEPFVRKGAYNFLDIPGEIRMKIYRYAFSQQGAQRQTPAHRGTIHTALLKTCRTVYSEARHLPLTLNRLCFPGPLEALHFLGFRLAPTVRNLFTGLDIEFHLFAYVTPVFACLLQELARMSITYLGLTVKGGYPADVILGHTCFVNHLRPLRSLTSLTLKLKSFQVTRKQNLEVEEEMRTQLIEGYGYKKLKKLGKSSVKKRNAPMEVDVKGRKPSKRPKKSQTGSKKQQLSKAKKLELQGLEEQQKASAKAQLETKQEMLATYGQLQTYATKLDPEARPANIRLEQARQAAVEGDEKKFSTLAFSIWETLEVQIQQVSAARAQLPAFIHHGAFSNLKIPAFMKNASPKPRGSVEDKRVDESDITKSAQGSLEL